MCIAVAHSEVVLNPLPDADDEDRVRPTGDTRRKLTDVLQRECQTTFNCNVERFRLDLYIDMILYYYIRI